MKNRLTNIAFLVVVLTFVAITSHAQKNNPLLSGRTELMKIIEKKGLETAVAEYWKAKNAKTGESKLNVNEVEVNNLGYDLIKKEKFKEALEILKLNTLEYPTSWNAWDSYAEVHVKIGDIKSAKELYKKALLINPNSIASKKSLDDLDYPNAIWTGSNEQKIMGLMTIWGEAKYAFPWFDKLPDLNWDAKVQEFIPRVVEAKDIESYYKVLAEFTNLLCDSHTQNEAPWGPLKKDDDAPAIEVQVVEDKFIIARVGNTSEIKDQNIYPGLEIVEVEKNIPVKTYFEEKVSRYFSADTKQAKNVWSIMIFMGKRGTKATFKVKEMNGTIREVKLTRDGLSSKNPFLPIFYQNYLSKTIETKKLEDGVLYVNIPNFNSTNIENGFQKLIDSIDLTSTKGLLIDLRYNGGGSSTIADNIIGHLIEKEVDKPLIKYLQYVAYYRKGDKTAELLQEKETIKPSSDKKYSGLLVILTGA
ncbi:MAG: S41 family peptidase, partial [Bacteroidota bacterium]